jgi:hypothetical protein
MEKITTVAELRLAIQALEYQRADDLLVIKYSFLHINRQLTPLKIINYTASVIIDAWLPLKGKQLINVIVQLFKVFGKRS